MLPGAVVLTAGRSCAGNDVAHSTLLDRVCACSYENLPKYRSYRVRNTVPLVSRCVCYRSSGAYATGHSVRMLQFLQCVIYATGRSGAYATGLPVHMLQVSRCICYRSRGAYATGEAVPAPCPEGRYCLESAGPTECPRLHYRDVTGGANISDCFACVPGYWCNATGTRHHHRYVSQRRLDDKYWTSISSLAFR